MCAMDACRAPVCVPVRNARVPCFYACVPVRNACMLFSCVCVCVCAICMCRASLYVCVRARTCACVHVHVRVCVRRTGNAMQKCSGESLVHMCFGCDVKCAQTRPWQVQAKDLLRVRMHQQEVPGQALPL